VFIQGRALNRQITRFLSSKSLYIPIKVGNLRAVVDKSTIAELKQFPWLVFF